MSRKFSAARKRAFLTYLARTGNQTLAAEMAKVSRSWVGLHRSTDAGFDADCREALRQARDRLIAAAASLDDGGEPPHPPAAKAAGPSLSRAGRGAEASRYFAGAELVVRGTGGSGGGKRVQIGRARVKQWTPRVETRFLAALSASCNVKAACAEVGMWPPSAYNHRKRWPGFARRWDAAIDTGFARLEAALVEAGSCNPFADPDFPQDNPIREMSAMQALHLLNMHKHHVRGLGREPGRTSDPLKRAEQARAELERVMLRLAMLPDE